MDIVAMKNEVLAAGAPIAGSLLGIILSSFVVYFVYFAWRKLDFLRLEDVHFTIFITWRLFWNPKDKIHIIFEELNKHEGTSAVCHISHRGRLYFLKDGSLVPHITGNKAVAEKLMASSKNMFGQNFGEAITASGDHPHRWLKAKQLMRPLVGIMSYSIFADKMVTEAAKSWHQSPGILLYKEALRVSVKATFLALFQMDLEELLSSQPKQMTIANFSDFVDAVSNFSMASAKEMVKDEMYEMVMHIVEKALVKAPSGTFGHGLMELTKDSSTGFTMKMALHNTLFYVGALPVMTSIVTHWSVFSMIRNPHHLVKAREGLEKNDKSHLLMCLKEVLRLYPPVSAYMPRRVKVDTCLGDVRITARSLVVALPMLLVDDQEFRPERWHDNFALVDENFESVQGFYAPFSSGSRSCLARYIMAPLFEDVVTKMLTNFDFALVENDPWEGIPTALQHVADNHIGFRPAKDLLFSVNKRETRK
jgi:cytochrome P450